MKSQYSRRPPSNSASEGVKVCRQCQCRLSARVWSSSTSPHLVLLLYRAFQILESCSFAESTVLPRCSLLTEEGCGDESFRCAVCIEGDFFVERQSVRLSWPLLSGRGLLAFSKQLHDANFTLSPIDNLEVSREIVLLDTTAPPRTQRPIVTWCTFRVSFLPMGTTPCIPNITEPRVYTGGA